MTGLVLFETGVTIMEPCHNSGNREVTGRWRDSTLLTGRLELLVGNE